MRITASSEHQRQRAASPLLRSKLRRPRVPEYFVVRPRLEAVLATVPTRPLTLVIAPAGSGKTQLLSNWVAHTTTRVAWLSLEETDGEPVVLWNGILAALDQSARLCRWLRSLATYERFAVTFQGALTESVVSIARAPCARHRAPTARRSTLTTWCSVPLAIDPARGIKQPWPSWCHRTAS